MLRRVDLRAVEKSGVNANVFHGRPPPRPNEALPLKNEKDTSFINVGSLQPKDSWVSEVIILRQLFFVFTRSNQYEVPFLRKDTCSGFFTSPKPPITVL